MSAVHVTLTGGDGNHTLARDRLIVGLVSAKGSPGVTTSAVGLAARWPYPGGVVVEVDPAGGDLAARFGRHFEPGLSAMALDGRSADADMDPQRWLQPLPCGVSAVLAPPGTAAAASLVELGQRAAPQLETLAGQHPVVVADAGRWRPGSAADAVLSVADVLLVVARPMLDELRQVEVRLEALRALTGDVRLVLLGDGGWPPAEVSTSLGVPVVGVLPSDRDGAAALCGRSAPRRGWASAGWTRLPLLRACRSLASQLCEPQPRATSSLPVPRPDRQQRQVGAEAVAR